MRRPLGIGLIALLILLAQACSSSRKAADEGMRAEISVLADSIAADNVITTRYAARMPEESPPYRRRHRLMREARDAELIELLGHGNAVVRLAAFEGLYRRSDPGMDAYFAAIIDDNSQIQYIRGDLSQFMPMLEYAHRYILGLELPGEAVPEEREAIESLYTPSDELVRSSADRIGSYRMLRGGSRDGLR